MVTTAARRSNLSRTNRRRTMQERNYRAPPLAATGEITFPASSWELDEHAGGQSSFKPREYYRPHPRMRRVAQVLPRLLGALTRARRNALPYPGSPHRAAATL